jgi:very-short-patch-repair endonuclease
MSVAADTHGVVTAEMATEAGVSRSRFGRLRRAGRLQHVCGVGYVLGTRAPTVRQRAVAARLTWPDSIVCFRTAAVLHGMPIVDDGATHVLVPDGRRSMKGLVAHHWSVRPVQVDDHGTWAITDRLTTLADVLGRLPNTEAWGRFAWLVTRDLITSTELRAQLAERTHLYGVVRLRAMAAALDRGAVSLAEVELHDLLRKRGFTGWLGNAKIFRRNRIVARADILFVESRVIIEYDGRLAHPQTRSAEDRRRDRLLRSLGYHVIHVRWERLIFTPQALLAELEAALLSRAA